MTPAQAALAHASISVRFSHFWSRIERTLVGRGLKARNRAWDIMAHYREVARRGLPEMTVREQIEALGWTRVAGKTVRKSDAAQAAAVECGPAVSSTQAWILAGCPAVEATNAA
jgi:hypothetical protein